MNIQETIAPLPSALEGSTTIREFCKRNRISTGTLHMLWRTGRGPRRMVIGRIVRISAEAELEWRRAIEAFPVPAERPWTADAGKRTAEHKGAA